MTFIKRRKKQLCAFCEKEFFPIQKGQLTHLSDDCVKGYLERFNSPESIDARLSEMKVATTKNSVYESRLEDEINAIVRLIDYDVPCTSCNGFGKAQAGHFHSVGANPSIRYNLHGIHIQDFHCNVEKSANIIKYGAGLTDRYGKEYREYVEFTLVKDYPRIGLNKHDLDTAIKNAREIKRALQASPDKTPRPASERIALRDRLNSEIGIYQKPYLK